MVSFFWHGEFFGMVSFFWHGEFFFLKKFFFFVAFINFNKKKKKFNTFFLFEMSLFDEIYVGD
jgi:hypothetical protein